MKKLWGICFLVLALVGCAPEAEGEAILLDEPVLSSGVYVDGNLIPCRETSLAFPVSGEVEAISAIEGEVVVEGAVLAQLSGGAAAEARLADIEAAEFEAQMALNVLIESAQIDRTNAWQRVLDSRIMITAAQESLDKFDMDRYEDDIEDSDTRLAEAESDLEEAQDVLSDYSDLDLDNPTYRRYEDDVEKAQEELHAAEREREELEVEYEQLSLNLERASALYVQAMDDYAALSDGPDKDQQELLQARISALDANRFAMEENLEDLLLHAPFTGTIADVDLEEGSLIAAGLPVVWMADFTCWTIETEDLTEQEVVQIQEGDEITAVLDALPDISLSGTVESIDLLPTLYLGDVTYTARILLDEVPAEARWGMTVVVSFPE